MLFAIIVDGGGGSGGGVAALAPHRVLTAKKGVRLQRERRVLEEEKRHVRQVSVSFKVKETCGTK